MLQLTDILNRKVNKQVSDTMLLTTGKEIMFVTGNTYYKGFVYMTDIRFGVSNRTSVPTVEMRIELSNITLVKDDWNEKDRTGYLGLAT